MIMIKSPYYLAALLIISFWNISIGKAQESQNTAHVYGIQYRPPQGIEGFQFMNKDWLPANITLFDNQVVKNLLVKYDIVNNNLTYYNPKLKSIYTIDPVTLKAFTTNPDDADSAYFFHYSGNEVRFRLKQGDFVRQAYNGKHIKFLIRYTSEISDAIEINGKDKIIPEVYYFLFDGTTTKEIKLNVKSVINVLQKRKKEIRKCAKRIHFRRKSEDFMINLLHEVDLLLSDTDTINL